MKNLSVTDVRAVKGDSGFLIDDGRTSVLWDTGFGFTGFQVAENIKNNLKDRPLDYIFLSHSHYDHALGSAYILEKYPDAVVAASAYAADVFKRPGALKSMKELDRKAADASEAGEYPFLGEKLRVDIPVNDGDIITAGDLHFQILALPGHTRCSIGFYCPEKELLLAPETLGVFDGKSIVAPAFLVGCRMTLESVDKVLKLPVRRILAPHLGLMDEEQTAFYLSHMRSSVTETTDSVIGMLKDGRSDEDILDWYKDKFWRGCIREFYPENAMRLNTSIMINCIRKENITAV